VDAVAAEIANNIRCSMCGLRNGPNEMAAKYKHTLMRLKEHILLNNIEEAKKILDEY
jgi:hypothetical protein